MIRRPYQTIPAIVFQSGALMVMFRQVLTDCTAQSMLMVLLLVLLRIRTSARRTTLKARLTTVQHISTTLELPGILAVTACLPCPVAQPSTLQSPIPWLVVSIIVVYTILAKWSTGRDRTPTVRQMNPTAFQPLSMERAVLRLRRLARDTRRRIPSSMFIAVRV